jgi:hypothetical protein
MDDDGWEGGDDEDYVAEDCNAQCIEDGFVSPEIGIRDVGSEQRDYVYPEGVKGSNSS